jgi:hypothetical protein
VELAFLTLLLKDGADRVGRGVAINNKWVFESGLTKDGSRTYGVHESLKGRLVFVIPVEFAALSAKSHEGVEGCSEHTEVLNVHAIEVEEAKECSYFSQSGGSFPIFDAIDFDRIHCNTIFADDHS